MVFSRKGESLKVAVLTPVRRGGPYFWGQNLSYLLNLNGFESKHIHKLSEILIAPFYQNADLVHASIPLTYRFWRKPVIMTIKGDYTIEQRKWKPSYTSAIKKADVITIPSRFLKEKLDLEDAYVIPNAVFPERFKVVKHSDNHVINIVTITKFYFKDKAEGVLDMMKLLQEIQKNTDKQIKYTVVGGGPHLEEIKKRAKTYGDIDINFEGWSANPAQILKFSDIFVYYSYHDNFPNVILEAMASGLPVITNSVGAVQEIIENRKDGYVARCEEDYQEFLLTLLNDCKMRDRLGQNARKTVEKKFNWNIIINEYLKIYTMLIHI